MDGFLVFILGLALGFMVGIAVGSSALTDYAKVNKNQDGLYASYEKRMYRLEEVKSK